MNFCIYNFLGSDSYEENRWDGGSVPVSGKQRISTVADTYFDKEAVTPHPYNRTGQQDVISGDETTSGEFRPGNTGTKDDPAFYVKTLSLPALNCRIKWDGFRKFKTKYQNAALKLRN